MFRGQTRPDASMLLLLVAVSVAQEGKSASSRGDALLASASAGELANATRLIEAGVPLEVRDLHLRTPLHRAVLGGHDEMVALLLDAGAGRYVPASAAAMCSATRALTCVACEIGPM